MSLQRTNDPGYVSDEEQAQLSLWLRRDNLFNRKSIKNKLKIIDILPDLIIVNKNRNLCTKIMSLHKVQRHFH